MQLKQVDSDVSQVAQLPVHLVHMPPNSSEVSLSNSKKPGGHSYEHVFVS